MELIKKEAVETVKAVINMLEKLSNAYGVGFQKDAANVAKELLCKYCDDVYIDNLGNVIGEIRCGEGHNAKTLMLEAHIDEIGFIVTSVDEGGFVKVDKCGGIDTRTLTGSEVTIHASGELDGVKNHELLGVFCSIPPHLQKGESKELPEVAERAIDIGLSGELAKRLVRAGDFASFRRNFSVLDEEKGYVVGKSMDDRAGVAAVLCCLEMLKNSATELNCNLAIVFAVQEELGCRGAKTASFVTNPDYAIVVDVSFACTPDADANKCGVLGSGPMIGTAPTLDYDVTQKLIAICETADDKIPFQHEVMAGDTGTDADSISGSGDGVKTGLISIPLRYMHTANEVVCVDDIINVSRIMAEFVKDFK